jgi:hypothetical protein
MLFENKNAGLLTGPPPPAPEYMQLMHIHAGLVKIEAFLSSLNLSYANFADHSESLYIDNKCASSSIIPCWDRDEYCIITTAGLVYPNFFLFLYSGYCWKYTSQDFIKCVARAS